MNVEDTANKIVLFSVYSMTQETKFLGSRFSPGSAETLAR